MVLNETKELKAKHSSLSIQVSADLTVQVIPNSQFDFLMTSKEVALGYATSEYVIRRHKLEHSSELVEGKHYIKGVSFSHTLSNAQPHQVFWTKRGMVRLGFFIKSERAKLFRDWAEDFIINETERKLIGDHIQVKRLKPRGNHNRLTQDRMIDLLHDVCMIEDKELRTSILNKLKGGDHA